MSSSVSRPLIVLVLLGAVALVVAGRLVLGDDPEPSADEIAAPEPAVADPPARPERVSRRPRERTERVRPATATAADSDARDERPPEPVTRRERLLVAEGESVRLPRGVVEIAGPIDVQGTVHAEHTTLILDGAEQTLSGTLAAHGVVLRSGTKRLRGRFRTLATDPSQAGDARMVVEADATLLVEEGGEWHTPNAYGFHAQGHVIVDGGVFRCRFTNGDGGERGGRSWAQGSALTVLRGRFVGGGDADFRGAAVTIHDGEIAIDDDLWHTGDRLTVYGGLVRNSVHGGAFQIHGSVDLRGGELRVHQRGNRGLVLGEDARFVSSGGRLTIHRDAPETAESGILLRANLRVHRLEIHGRTQFDARSADWTHLEVLTELTIAPGKTFLARAGRLIADYVDLEDAGTLIR